MTIPFDFNKRAAIECGEYKVETANGIPVEIVRWDCRGDYPILAIMDGRTGTDADFYNIYGESISGDEKFKLVMKVKLNPLEKCLIEFFNNRMDLETDKDGVHNIHDVESQLKAYAERITNIVKDQLISEGYVIINLKDEGTSKMPDFLKEYNDKVDAEVGSSCYNEKVDIVGLHNISEMLISAYNQGKDECKSLRWRKIRMGERLPCVAYLWSVSFDKYAETFKGRLMPNIKGATVGADTWYLPVQVIHDLPKE